MKYRYHLLAILIHLVGVALYFTPLFKRADDTVMNGFEAMNTYWISIAIFTLMVIPLGVHFLGIIRFDIYKKIESGLVIWMNIWIVLAALLITYFSNITNVYTYLLVGVIVTSVYNQYRIKNQ